MSATPCPLCDDTGWRPVGKGRERRVVRCECRQRARAERLLNAARIPARYRDCELSNFTTASSGLDPRSPVAIANRWVRMYPTERQGVLFVGPIGVGKTHLAVGMVKELIRTKGVQCLFCDYRELLKEIQNSYNPSVQTTELQVLQPIFDANVLILDELGASKPTLWVWDTVSLILNSRYNDLRTTILTTNYPDAPSLDSPERTRYKVGPREESLGDRITDRMWSRLHEMCKVVEVTGSDFRLDKDHCNK